MMRLMRLFCDKSFTSEFVAVIERICQFDVSSSTSSVLAALPVALGDGVGAEWSGRCVGLRQGSLPVGACHPAALPEVCVLLEASQTG